VKSSQNTAWVGGAGVLAVLLVIATYFLVIAPQRTQAADLATQEAQTRANNGQIEAQIEVLQSQFESLDEKREEIAAIKATLPNAADVPQLLRQVSGYAVTSGVQLTQITPGAATAFAVDGTDASAAVAATAGTTAGSTEVASGIVQIPLTIVVGGTFPQVEMYTKQLQADMTRHLLVQTLTVSTDQASGQAAASNKVTATITGAVFVLQDTISAATGSASTATTVGTSSTPAVTAGSNASSGTVS
jgi:type IV pilus assembly protein PilO